MRQTKGFVLGLLLGLLLSGGTAWAAGCFGNGYLNGWSVTSMGGEIICDDPFVWSGTHEIECQE